MAIITKAADWFLCEVCGREWLATPVPPYKCISRECRSTRWNKANTDAMKALYADKMRDRVTANKIKRTARTPEEARAAINEGQRERRLKAKLELWKSCHSQPVMWAERKRQERKVCPCDNCFKNKFQGGDLECQKVSIK